MQNGSSTILQSANESRGFFGTIGQHADSHEAWMLAVDAIGRATGCSDEGVWAFLDSRYGRHFAEEVVSAVCSGRDLAAAVDDVVERWMELRIDTLIEREIGIPEGLPYLTGFVFTREALLDAPG
jgi:hypothetical protein